MRQVATTALRTVSRRRTPAIALLLAAALAVRLEAAIAGDQAGPAAPAIPATTHEVAGLAHATSIELDRFEIPTIRAASLGDAVFAEGWIHAGERFLQMDVARRSAAGELSELLATAVEMDREARPLGLRAVAREAVDRLPDRHRVLLERYAAGVNARLATTPIVEYRLLGATPATWLPEDTMLVQLMMARFLDTSWADDLARESLLSAASAELARFLTSPAGPLDASIDGSPMPAPPALPGPDVLDLRAASAAAEPVAPGRTDAPRETHPGSNAFAVAGSRTRDGRAIVGNDMHLTLTAPGVWYRVRLTWPEGDVVGLSLPGVPLIVQGSNGRVAWGFTNLTADVSDVLLVDVEADPRPEITRELVRIGRGESAVDLEVRRTPFGPVIDTRADGTLVVLRWPLLAPGGLDCGLFDLVFSTDLESALAAARGWHGPPQNVLVADDRGRIGWTIGGTLPVRATRVPAPLDGSASLPTPIAFLPPAEKPTIVDPPSGVLASGNQCPIAPVGPLAAVLGGDEAPGDRAFRLRELLLARSDWDEGTLHDVQLDLRSPRLLRWRDALLAALGEVAEPSPVHAAYVILRDWTGSTAADERSPVLLDALRSAARSDYAAAIAAQLGIPTSAVRPAVTDEAMLRLFESGAPHLVPAPHADRAAFVTSLLARAGVAAGDGKGDFRARGDDNRAAIRHPASDALGAAARMAAMPAARLPGHPTSVRVQTPGFGASQRSVVAPSRHDAAILVTPCGQSGLPTSPHFRSLHRPWQDGEPFPLLPGDAARRIDLVPQDLDPQDRAPNVAAPSTSRP